MLSQWAGWIAPVATALAAMMTAANLGARLTGWGFVVFTLGAICWIAVGMSTGQTNLIAANAFLALVDLVGIWRWLGRQRAYEDGAKSAESASRKASAADLFTATGLAGMPVATQGGEPIGKAVEGLIECGSGKISYVVVSTTSTAGIAEQLRAVPRDEVEFHHDRLALRMRRAQFEALPPLEADDWPASA